MILSMKLNLKDANPAGSFEEIVNKFYSDFLKGQESLGSEFTKILHDNLWDLYER